MPVPVQLQWHREKRLGHRLREELESKSRHNSPRQRAGPLVGTRGRLAGSGAAWSNTTRNTKGAAWSCTKEQLVELLDRNMGEVRDLSPRLVSIDLSPDSALLPSCPTKSSPPYCAPATAFRLQRHSVWGALFSSGSAAVTEYRSVATAASNIPVTMLVVLPMSCQSINF